MKKMLLVDGNSMLFRAYYATAYGRPMSTSNGIPTGAVFGFSNMLHKAIELIQPDYLCVAFDSAKKNFRHELYPEYKGGRKETPEDLAAQFSVVREFLDEWNVFRYEQEGIEADDIIGTIASSYPECEVSILSSDRDLLQIIDTLCLAGFSSCRVQRGKQHRAHYKERTDNVDSQTDPAEDDSCFILFLTTDDQTDQ